MLSRVSQLIAISLLCLVGCSTESSNKSNAKYISGCWERSQFNTDGASSGYWKETYKLEPGGSYSRESVVKITPVVIRPVEPHYSSGEWIIDDGYVVIQWKDGSKVTLKVISKYELIQVGDSIAFRRC